MTHPERRFDTVAGLACYNALLIMLLLAMPAQGQEVTPVAPDAEGRFTFEAEAFVDNVAAQVGPHRWVAVDTAEASGGQAMVARPNAGANKSLTSTAFVESPLLVYVLEVPAGAAGQYEPWVRGYGPTGGDDSFWLGFADNPSARTTVQVDLRIGRFGWMTASSNVTIELVEGENVIGVWMREDGTWLDQFIIQPAGLEPPAEPEEPPLDIPRASAVPVVDGVREEVWSGAQVVPLLKVANNDPPSGPDDLTATAWVMWDTAALYAFFEVQDEALFNDSNEGWRDDRPEVYVDLGNEKCNRCRDRNDAYWEFEWNGTRITGDGATKAPGSTYAWQTTEGGYTVEARMTWGEMGHPIAEGQLIGFELMVNDSDQPGEVRETKLSWYSPIDEAWQWSNELGTARLMGQAPPLDTEEHAGLPTGFTIESVYPNPFHGSASVLMKITRPGTYALAVHNVLGQQVHASRFVAHEAGRRELPLHVPEAASGVYLVSILHEATGKKSAMQALLVR